MRQRAGSQKRMAKFEDDADAAEILQTTARGFRINDRNTIGQLRFGFMMIEHNHIRTAPAKIDNFLTRRCAAIDRDEKLRVMLLETTLHALAAQAVTFFHPQR